MLSSPGMTAGFTRFQCACYSLCTVTCPKQSTIQVPVNVISGAQYNACYNAAVTQPSHDLHSGLHWIQAGSSPGTRGRSAPLGSSSNCGSCSTESPSPPAAVWASRGVTRWAGGVCDDPWGPGKRVQGGSRGDDNRQAARERLSAPCGATDQADCHARDQPTAGTSLAAKAQASAVI
jgi:hypothetical protein